MSNQSLVADRTNEEKSQTGAEEKRPVEPMQDYYQLQTMLLRTTLLFAGVVFCAVWIFISRNTALSYLLGAGVGIVYLKLLARDVERLGTVKQRLGGKGLALFTGLIIVACKQQELQILPVFLGFMSYKAGIIAHGIQLMMIPSSQSEQVERSIADENS